MTGKIVSLDNGEMGVLSNDILGTPIYLSIHPSNKTQEFKENDSVEFIIVDEFTHPNLFQKISWGEGTETAYILKILQ